ncbi:hypothetical protein B0H12DRAFT_1033161, partial [Mycena haematopus]
MTGSVPLTFSAPVRTVLDMPLRNSREAPKTFKGKHAEVEYFVQHYDRLLIKYRVNNAYDQCECILDYCSSDVQAFIRASEHYQDRDWPKLRREILKCYDADRALTRYRPGDITAYTLKTKNKPIHNLSQWKKYYIRYKTMAGTLYRQGHVTKVNVDVYFWLGLHKDLRRTLENRILQSAPKRNSRNPYSMREINEAAEWYFRRNRAETMVVNAADYDIDDDGGYYEISSEEEDSDDESGDSDYESYRRKRREKKEKRRSRREKEKEKAVRNPNSVDSSERTVKPSGTALEVADLIRRLNKMTIDDVEYAPTYYSIMALDQTGHAINCISPPKLQGGWRPNGRPRPPTPSPREAFKANLTTTPATYPNNIPLGERSETPAPAENSSGCFGCGKEGHLAINCPDIRELEQAGIVKIDEENRRIKMSNGSYINKSYEETPEAMQTRFVEVTNEESSQSDSGEYMEWINGQDAEGTEDESDWAPGDKQVNGADRTVPSTRAARRLAFDGVHVPRREKPKEVDTEAPKASSPKKSPTPEKPVVGKIRDILSDVQPYDARRPRISEEQDIEMKEIPVEKRARHDPSRKENEGSEKLPARRTATEKSADASTTEPSKSEIKTTGRQSDIQSTVQLPKIVDRILDLELPITVREVLAASKEIRNGLQDTVRLKSVKAVLMGSGFPLVAQWTWPRTDGVLIRIEMEICGRRVVAIVDTGSQLNVVRADIAALVLHRPVDMTRTTAMNDANGGRGELRGFIHDVELSCGGVPTKTGLWVSQQAPFELLLGRPWQRNNLVTIDEREEGTYLVF